jgi:predicted anti-sigma-YlaC factor YlaD
MTCDEIRLELGAYVLGALGPAERMSVDGHVAHCPDCCAELAELAELPALLGRLSEKEAAEGIDEELPPDLLPQLLTRVSAERRRRRRGTVVAVAAAALVAVAGTGFAATQLVGQRSADQVVATSAAGVTTSASLRGEHDGTAISLRISGVTAGQWCRLIAVDDAGRQQVLSDWQADYEGVADITASAAAGPEQIRTLRVVTPQGGPLAELPVARS